MNFNYYAMKKILKWYFIISTISIFAIVGLIMLLIKNNTVNKIQIAKEEYIEANDENSANFYEDEKGIITTNNNLDKKISPNAVLIFETKYTDCGHVERNEKHIDNDMINMDFDEINNLYDQWDIKSFSPQKIVLCKTQKGICNEHFVIKDVDGKIAIFNETTSSKLKLVKNTEIETQYLPELDKINLKNGVKIYGERELNSYIENFE